MSTDPATSTAVGSELTLEVGPPAHGGSCVARAPDGRVVFVRHALPGERVVARVTDVRSKLLRAEAISVLNPSADRVVPPCPVARPGGCGGCDLQHVAPPAQRAWKATVVREQLLRLAGVDVEVPCVALPDPDPARPGLGWRRRVTLAVDAAGRAGLHPYRSSAVLAVGDCPIAAAGGAVRDALAALHPGAAAVEVAVDDTGAVRTTVRPRHGRPRHDGPAALHYEVGGRAFRARGFWQVHPAAAGVLAAEVLAQVALRPGERVLDLYAGAGLFAALLADAGGRVVAVEGDRRAAHDATGNVAGLDVEVWQGPVAEALADPALAGVDVVVLDPPRAGAGAAVATAVARLAPRVICYVACDPAALARDVAAFQRAGYALARVRAFDCFPMTHHVECVATLVPAGRRPAAD